MILHYLDPGNGKYTADPEYGESMSCTLLIYVSGSGHFGEILLQDCEQILLGYFLTLKSSIGNVGVCSAVIYS